jgi:hypothetical protein
LARELGELAEQSDDQLSSTVELSSDSSVSDLVVPGKNANVTLTSTPKNPNQISAPKNTPNRPIPILGANAPNRIRPLQSPAHANNGKRY